MRAIRTFCAAALLVGGGGAQGAFVVTPLDSAESRSNAVAFWSANGCSPSGVVAMARAMEHYCRAQPTASDVPQAASPLSAKRYGTACEFFETLDRHPAVCGHAYEITCFDFVASLLEDRFRTNLSPDDGAAIFLAPYNRTETVTSYAPMPTPRTAYMTSYYDWYRDFRASATGCGASDRLVVILASLYSCTPYPWVDLNSPFLAKKVLEGRWYGQRFALPTSPAVVLQHSVWKNVGVMCTVHTGLLFQRPGGYTYFEKCGGRGPFLRFDGENPSDVVGYYRKLVSLDSSTNKWSFVCVGTNDFVSLTRAVP